MSESAQSTQPRHPDAATDAKILGLILKGQLRPTSAISDGVGGTTLLADHPRFSHVLRLARAGTSIGALRSASFWNEREPTWTRDLSESPAYRIFFDISRQHATGFLVLQRRGASKVVAFSSGAAICVSSNLKREQLGPLLVRTNKLPQSYVDQAVALSKERKQMMGWALLHLGMLSPSELHEALHMQARERVTGALGWSDGSASFHADSRAAQLHPLVETPLLELMREGIWGERRLTVEQLEALTAPFFERSEKCRLNAELGVLKYELEPAEHELLTRVDAGKAPTAIHTFVEGHSDRQALLRAVYTFVQLDVIQLEAPPLEQPVLRSLDDLPPVGLARPVEPAGPKKATIRSGVKLSERAAGNAPSAVRPPSSEALAALSSVLTRPGETPEPARPASSSPASSPNDARSSATGPSAAAPDSTSASSPVSSSSRAKAGKAKDGRALDEYRLQLQLQDEGRRLLNSKQYGEAVQRFEKLVERQDKPVDAYAYLALGTLLAKGFDYKNKALGFAKQALELDPNNGLVRVAMYRALDSLGKAAGAAEQKAHALRLGATSPVYLTELKTLMALGTDTKVSRATSSRLSRADAMLIGAGVVLLLLFVLSNVLLHGRREYSYDGTDWFFYLRRGLLLVGGIVGLAVYRRSSLKRAFVDLGWQGDFLFTVVAVVLGAFVGWLSPVQRVANVPLIVMGLTLLHVIAEEVFFRGFVTRVLLDRIRDARGALLLSGLIFGFYHLTYYSFWHESLLWPRIYWSLAIGMLAGVPYAWMFHKSKGIIPPLVAHFAVNGAMMLRSLSQLS